MNVRDRDFFDKQVAQVLKRLPREVRRLLNTVPLHVEDHPPLRLRKELGIQDRGELLGHFFGVPLNAGMERYESGVHNSITLYRQGILETVLDDTGHLDLNELREQIRITILHELGHYHGLDEDDLDDAGYG